MPTRTFQPIFGKRIRVTRLDECGNFPAPGTACAYVATDGFVTVQLSAEVESGQEIITRKADGSLCVNERGADSFKRFTVGVTFCGVDPALMALLTNAEQYANYAGDIAGITIPEGTIDTKFAFELWTGLTGQACEPGVEEASGYLLLPFVNSGTLGDLEIGGENAIDFSMSGGFTLGRNNWGVGPYGVLNDETSEPAVLPTPLDVLDHLLLIDTNIAPPDITEGCAVMPAVGGGSGGTTAPAWAATTAYSIGDTVTLSDGSILQATIAGTSGSTEPTAPAATGDTVTDGTVTWELVSPGN